MARLWSRDIAGAAAKTFRYATNNPNIKAAFVFYGSARQPRMAYRQRGARFRSKRRCTVSVPERRAHQPNSTEDHRTRWQELKKTIRSGDLRRIDTASCAPDPPDPAAPQPKGNKAGDAAARSGSERRQRRGRETRRHATKRGCDGKRLLAAIVVENTGGHGVQPLRACGPVSASMAGTRPTTAVGGH